jgi:hypothetical protein
MNLYLQQTLLKMQIQKENKDPERGAREMYAINEKIGKWRISLMAEIQQTQVLPAPFIEAAGKTYLEDLSKAVGGIKGLDVSKLYGPQFVAGQSALQGQAEGLASGLGGYQPFLQAAQAATGPTAYQQYMSPYQQDVISTTLSEFDRQSQMGLPALQSQAIQAGAFGQGRGQVAEAEYQSASDRNRAALQAQLLQQGFGQAQSLAAQQYNQQVGLAGQTQGLLGQQIAGISTLGAQQQAQEQAGLTAQQQLAYQQGYQPLQAAQAYGQGVTGLIAGYPGQTRIEQSPSPTALQTGLGVASTLAGIYGKLNPPAPIQIGSDARLKENINLIGKSPSGLNVYTFKYKGNDNGIYQGVMAQEVPHASVLGDDGFYKVDYSKLDVEFKKVN